MPEKILDVTSNEQFKSDYTRYGIYILYRRVLSDYRDGLKPVQRRVLWAMYKNSKAVTSSVKSAAVVGDVMKWYHPHGDSCLDASTTIYSTDGNKYTIEELYKNNTESLNIYAVDRYTGNPIETVATHFRIGKYSTEIYNIKLSNGFILKCTGNHPILKVNEKKYDLFGGLMSSDFDFEKFTWVRADNLAVGDNIYNVKFYEDASKEIKSIKIESIKIEMLANPIPMYDFTVKGLENMIIPIEDPDICKNFICVHNSIYGTMKPMANWFETYIPLIDPSGNFGTFQGDGAAAARYTECRLSKFAIENVLGDVMENPEAVDWSPTYSSVTTEPDYLPVKVPLLLVNGSFGIGLGMRSEIPTHNLAEVIDATLMLMDNPEADVVLVPDHCMNCEIINTDFSKICKAGFGHYKIRGKVVEEDYKGKKALVIKSVPNLTYLNSITDKIEELIKKKKIIQIENCFDESNVNEMRYVIVLKAGSDPAYVKDVLYKNTGLEQNLRINFETLNGLNPLRMSYKSYLLSFIDFRKLTKFRVYSNKLQVVQTRIHERDAYIKVLESGEIDNVIAMIKKQKTVDDNALIEYLIKKLKITDLQARYIIEADLKKLSLGYLEKYKQEAIELEKTKSELLTHIMDDKIIENDIRQELIDIKRKYGKPRNCVIINENEASEIPKGEMVVAVTEKNFIRKVPANTAIGSFRNDTIKTVIKIDNADSILIFDEVGKVFKLPVHKIPFTDKNTNGIDIRFLIKSLTANINTIIPESVLKLFAEKGHHNNKHYLVTLTNSGLIKRMDLDDFVTVPPSGIIYAKLDKSDFIKDIVIAHSNFSLIVYSDRKATIMGVNDVPYLKRNTKGSKAISGVDYVDGVCVIHNACTDIVVFTESGKVNRINLIQGLPNTGKGKSGSNLIKLASGDKIVSVVSGNENDLIHVKCVNTDSIIKIADLKIGSSISSGDKLLTTRGNKIIRCYIER